MNLRELSAEYNRREDEILSKFEEAVKVLKAAKAERNKAYKDLEDWFDEMFDGLEVKEE